MTWKSNKLSDLKEQYAEALSDIYGFDEGRQLVDILTEYFFGITRVDQALNPGIRLSESEMLQLHRAVKELFKHKPVQYITGETLFLDLPLIVNESVLIPRPETEELVQLIAGNEQGKKLRFIDIGTGSGCIALSIKKILPESEVTAVDVSHEALAVAKENARLNKLSVHFEILDILQPSSYPAFSEYDVVVSNPPYVTQSDKRSMQKNVLDYEPETALFVDDDNPLVFYEAILRFCEAHLKDNGRIYFEINERKGPDVVKLLEKQHYKNIRLHKDIHGKERFIEGEKS